jgi:hypothetical protein
LVDARLDAKRGLGRCVGVDSGLAHLDRGAPTERIGIQGDRLIALEPAAREVDDDPGECRMRIDPNVRRGQGRVGVRRKGRGGSHRHEQNEEPLPHDGQENHLRVAVASSIQPSPT